MVVLMVATSCTLSPTTSEAATSPQRVSISPSVGPAGTRVTLSARNVRPRTGRVLFTLIGSDGSRTAIGSSKVTRTGSASLRVRMVSEGAIAAQHIVGGTEATTIGGTNFRFPTTPPSTVVIDVSSRGYASVTETNANRSYPVVGMRYTVNPVAPSRAAAEFVVTCDGSPSPSTTCTTNTPGRHVITVADLYNQYAPVSLEWNAVAPIRMTIPRGQPVTFALPPGASHVPGANGIACPQGTCSVAAGSHPVAGTDSSLLDTFTIDYLAVGDTVATTQQVIVTVFAITAPSQTAASSPFTVTVTGAAPRTGRIDLAIDNGGVGSENVSAGGTASFTASGWSPGVKTLTATWVWFDVGVPRQMVVSQPITLI